MSSYRFNTHKNTRNIKLPLSNDLQAKNHELLVVVKNETSIELLQTTSIKQIPAGTAGPLLDFYDPTDPYGDKHITTYLLEGITKFIAGKDINIGDFLVINESVPGTVEGFANVESTPQNCVIIGTSLETIVAGEEFAAFAQPFMRTSDKLSSDEKVSTWLARPSALDVDWCGVAWSKKLGIFVAVSRTNGEIMTSPDGTNWTNQINAPASPTYQDIAWSEELGLFVAVASNGKMSTSSNGIDWMLQSEFSNDWHSVIWVAEHGKFYAVASTGVDKVASSTNGFTWNTVNVPDAPWNGITYSKKLNALCVVAPSGMNQVIISEDDGLNWFPTSAANQNAWVKVAWSEKIGLFVAVSETGTGDRVMTSPDGISWTAQQSAADNGWGNIVWSDEQEQFVAVSHSGVGNRVMTSPDGISWTSQESANNNQWFGLAYSKELDIFVSVSKSGVGNRVMTSKI